MFFHMKAHKLLGLSHELLRFALGLIEANQYLSHHGVVAFHGVILGAGVVHSLMD